MPKLTTITAIAVCFILSLCSLSFAQGTESLTITTYYPSPYGSYNQLTSNSAKIGTTYSQSGTPFVANNLLVEGNVGIGTISPQAKLDVNGGIKLGDSVTCNASTAGVLRYNSGAIQYCNGTSWLTPSGNFGGMFGVNLVLGCNATNPFTGGCSCPPGFVDEQFLVIWTTALWEVLHFCYK